MQFFAGLVLAIFFCFSSGDEVTQEQPSVQKTEKEQVSLKCSFKSTSSAYYIYWYRQYPQSALHYILQRGSQGYSHTTDFANGKFDSTVSSSETLLTISKLTPEDTAVYYCALRPVRSNWGVALGVRLDRSAALTFGKGTNLSVKPKGDNREPVLSILRNKEHADRPVCLATGFFPKDGQMDLMSDDGQKRSIPLDKAPLSSDKTYFFVGLPKGSIKNCSLHGITEPKEVPQSTEEDTKSNTETPEIRCVPPPAENVTGISTKHNDYPKVNFMSLAVNGLRILFAKTVTFNMLMTLKAVVF